MQWQELGLEIDCFACKGTKKYTVQDVATGLPREIDCPTCNATGKVPSAAGEHLLDFLTRHLTYTTWGKRRLERLRVPDR